MMQLTAPDEDTRSLIVVNGSILVALLAFAAMPAFLGAYVDSLGISLAGAGRIASAETIAMALGCASASFGLTRPGVNLRRVVIWSFVLQALAQLASAGATTELALGTARGVSGFTAGLIYTAASIYISGLKRPDRPYAIFYAMLFVNGPLGLLSMPYLLKWVGLSGVYLGYCAMLAVSLIFFGRYPQYRAEKEPYESLQQAGPAVAQPGVMVLLLAILVNFICNGGVWIYAERIGTATGISSDELGMLLAVGMVSGLIGTVIVSIVGDRLGRLLPLIATHISLITVMAWLFSGPGLWGYFGAIVLLNISVTTMTPYFLAALAAADECGRAPVFGTLSYVAGYGLGPATLSLFLGDESFQEAFVLAGAGLVISLLLTLAGFSLLRASHASRPGLQ